MVEKRQCQERVFNGRLPDYQCQKKAVVDRDGKFYCKVHDPEYIKEKKRKWHERFAKEQVENRKRWHRKEVTEKVCEPFTTEWLEANANFILASKDMYEALKKIVAEGTRCLGIVQQNNPLRGIYNIDEVDRVARLAIAKIAKAAGTDKFTRG